MTGIVASIHLDTRELDRITKELRPRAQKILRETAKVVEGRAKTLCPRDPARMPKDPSQPVTGHLRSNIQTEQMEEFTWWVHTGDVPYARAQELGYDAGHLPARPYLTPAVEWTRPHFDERWKELFE